MLKLANMFHHIPGFYFVYSVDESDSGFRPKTYPLASIIELRTNLVITKTKREVDGQALNRLDHTEGVLFLKEGYYEWNDRIEDYQKLTDDMYYQRMKGFKSEVEEFAANLCGYVQDTLSERKFTITGVGWEVEQNKEGNPILTLSICFGKQVIRHSFPLTMQLPKNYTIDTWGNLVTELLEGLKTAV